MCWYHLSKNIYIFKAKNEQQETLQADKELKQEAKQKKKKQDGLSRGSLHKWVFSCFLKVSLVSTS